MLQELQRAHPDWNSRMVGFRLDYIAGKLAPLAKDIPPPAGPVPASASAPADGRPADSIQQLQAENRRLSGQISFLEAKLREALKVQPASVDPQELARAQEQLKALQKERDVLAVTLEQAGIKPSPAARAAAMSTAPAAASPAPVVSEAGLLDVLKHQNAELVRKVAELESRGAGGDAAEMRRWKETVAALAASNQVLQAERVTMESRLLALSKASADGPDGRKKNYEKKLADARAEAEAAQKERDTLRRQLDATTRELKKLGGKRGAPAPVTGGATPEQELESLRARLAVLEAKAVPFSAEELALLKHAPARVAAAEPTPVPANNAPATNAPAGPAAGPPRRKELPAGAGPILRDADRALDAGRLDEAERKLRDILRQDENHPFILGKLAAVQMDQDRTAEAEQSLKKALAADPQDSMCLYLMGRLKVQQSKFDEGIDLLGQAVKLTPDNFNAHYYLGWALSEKGQRQAAESALRRVIQLKPNWGQAHYLLAVIYATQEPTFKGLAQYHYKRAIAGGSPRNPELERFMEKGPQPAPAGK